MRHYWNCFLHLLSYEKMSNHSRKSLSESSAAFIKSFLRPPINLLRSRELGNHQLLYFRRSIIFDQKLILLK